MISNIDITFNGTSASSLGLVVTSIKTKKPARKFQGFNIPGRNGDILVYEDAWENVPIDIGFTILGNAAGDTIDLASAMMAWLTKPKGYARLTFSNDVTHYRMAAVHEDIDIKDELTKTGSVVIPFDCKPQRFLLSGESVALTLYPSASSAGTTGVGSQIYNDDFIAEAVISRAYPWKQPFPEFRDEQTTCVHMAGITGAEKVRLQYGPDVSSMVVAYVTSGSPLIGGTFTSAAFFRIYFTAGQPLILPRVYNPGAMTYTAEYLCFSTPTYWEVLDASDNVLASSMPSSDTLTPPAGVMDYSPLIEIGVSGAVNGFVATVGDGRITLNTPAAVDAGTISTITIDGETYNAYALIGDAIVSLNPYVSLDGEFRLPGDAPSMVRASDSIDSISVTPRWWTL